MGAEVDCRAGLRRLIHHLFGVGQEPGIGRVRRIDGEWGEYPDVYGERHQGAAMAYDEDPIDGLLYVAGMLPYPLSDMEASLYGPDESISYYPRASI